MSADWPEVTLEEVTTILGDGLHGTPSYYENGEYYFINGNNLGNGKIIIDDKTKRASKEEFLKHKKNLNDRTILVSINGTIGNVGLYNGEKVFLGKSACYFNVKDDVDKQFVRYVVTGPHFQNYIFSLATGSTIKNVSLKLMRNYTFRLPPLDIQREISKILEDLDNKIELNRQINQTLEQIAQAIFKSWFVDIEPIKAKIETKQNGQDPERAAMRTISGKTDEELDQLSEEQLQQLTAIAAHFPDELEDSELGEIPLGWKVKKIEECIKRFPVGKKFSQKTASEHGAIPILDQGKSGIIGYHNEKPGVLASPDDPIIVFANHTCYMRIIMHDFSAIQNVLPFKGVDRNIYWIFMSTYGKQSFDEYKGHWPDFVIKLLVDPNNSLDKVYGGYVAEFFKMIYYNEKENITLSKTRDSLLPKLLTGEIAVEAD